MQVGRLELQEALLALGQRSSSIGDIEIKGNGCILVKRAGDPFASVTLTNLTFCNRLTLLAKRGKPTNSTLALELPRGEDFNFGPEAQLQVARLIDIENPAEGILEDMHAERISHDHIATSL